MQVKRITNKEEYTQKAEKHLGIFGSRQWLDIYGDQLVLNGIYSNDNKLLGGYYFQENKEFGLKYIKLPPYSPHCGYFFESGSSNRSAFHASIKESMQLICESLNNEGFKLIQFAFPPGITDMQTFIWEKYKVIPAYTYRLNLNKDIEELKNHFDPKTRNSIQKASKEDLDIRDSGNGAEELCLFFRTHLRETGANVYEKELKALIFGFANTNNCFYYTAYSRGRLIGAVLCVYDSAAAYYLLGASDKSARLQGLNALLLSRCIGKAKELGCGVFDFEGSMLKGVEKFFRGFGAELVPYFTLNKAWLPIELLLKFRNRERF